MTIEQIKAEAKKHPGQGPACGQAQAALKDCGAEEPPAQALEEVAGGARLVSVPGFTLDEMTAGFSAEIQDTGLQDIPAATRAGLDGVSTWGLAGR